MKLSLVFAFGLVSSLASAQLLDGGFESFVIPPGNSFIDNPPSPAWTHSGSGVSMGPTWFPTPYEGTNFAFVRGDGGTLTRTIENLVPGIPYRLRFVMSEAANASCRVRITINGTNSWELNPLDNNWRVYEMPEMIPTSTSQSVSITTVEANNSDVFDAFEVVTTPHTDNLRGGNFDLPNYANGRFRYSPSFLADLRWSFGPPTSSGPGAGIVSEGGPFGPGPAQTGNMYCFLQGNGYAEQILQNLTVGNKYAVRYYHRRNLNQTAHIVALKLNGATIDSFTNPVPWTLRTTALFTATSPKMTIRFEGVQTNNNLGTHIDTVQLLPSTAGHDFRYSLFLSDVVADSASLIPVTVTVRQGTTTVHSATTVSPPFGIFRPEIPLSVTGPVQIEFDTPTHLKKTVNATMPPTNPNGGFITMKNGDADGSGEVDAADIDLVISKFGTTISQTTYNPNADLDKTGEVDASDIDVAIANFGSVDQ